MMSDLSEFEESMRREISAFQDESEKERAKRLAQAAEQTILPSKKPRPTQRPTKQQVESYKTGHLVKLAVRTKRLELDTVFEHRSSSISRLEAQMEAEEAAKKAGYPIIGYLIDIERL
ncbi:hypothetical protein [Halomonas sp. YLGW01]|uniref:hypothetical protein n=1 Tax=Halomonas sp. YLGW01 TaxID=2773308 RepID=UPI00178754C0|nr:hypothetical protein [Halomonas sp. YLGW01]